MSTTAPVICNPGVWTLVASGATGITDIKIQGPAFGYLVAIGSSPPSVTTVGAYPETTSGEFQARNIASTDNVYVAPTGIAPITISDITSIAISSGGGGGGGGSGGAVTVADGAAATIGAKADAAYSDATGAAAGSLIAISKWIGIKLSSILGALGTPFQAGGSIGNTAFGISGTLPGFTSTPTVNIGTAPGMTLTAGSATIGAISNSAFSITGALPAGGNALGSVSISNLPASQAITASALPLPSGAAADGTDATGVTAPSGAVGIRGWLSGIYNRLGSPLSVTGSFWQTTQPVSGTFWQTTQPVSAAALPLPSGAAADGIDATSATQMSGGVGIRGWLSGIYTVLKSALTLPAAPYAGQQATTASAAALPSQALVNGIVVTAMAANSGTVTVGATGVTSASGYQLSAGQSISFAVANANSVFIIGQNTTDRIMFAGN